MTVEGSVAHEPGLTVQRRETAFFLRRRFLRWFAPVTALSLLFLAALAYSGNLLLPLDRITEVKGKLASKADFFEDAEVRRILMRHQIRVTTTRSSSREIATHDIDQYDFVFPSGVPAAELIFRQAPQARRFPPFVSPLVLATFREYAETLRAAGVAESQAIPDQAGSLYYRIDMTKFLDLIRRKTRWNDLGVARRGVQNENRIVAQTPGVCESNSAGTYLGMVAFLENGGDVVQAENAQAVAERIKPLLTVMGQPSREIFESYTAAEGKAIAPVVVVYEHQYLAYQLNHQARSGRPDADRVLLYPDIAFMTQPVYMSLNAKGDRIGDLIISDPGLRSRATELGYRLINRQGVPPGTQVESLLRERGIPVPRANVEDTSSRMPTVDNLEEMIKYVGDCPPSEPS